MEGFLRFRLPPVVPDLDESSHAMVAVRFPSWLQCPHCDNRRHESLGYLYLDEQPDSRIQYCRICKIYFKLFDTREWLDPPFWPAIEWTSLHLDLLAQREGWLQAPSPAPAMYGTGT